MRRHIGLWISCALLCVAAFGCTGDKAAKKADIPTGAELWRAEALRLPAGSPLVVELRAGVLLAGADSLHGWLVADPAMFGPEGRELTQAFVSLRAALGELFGGDALLGVTWAGHGLDLSRPWSVGLLPISGAALERLELTEGALAQRIGVAPGAGLMQRLDARLAELKDKGQPPVGLYAEAARLVTDMVVVPGLRVALPIKDEARLIGALDKVMNNLDALLMAGGPELPKDVRRVYYGEDRSMQLVLRVQGDVALLDLLWASEAQMTPAQAAAVTVQPGRPAAPRAPGEPALALSMDQRGMGHLLRWWLYREALKGAGKVSASERDAAFLSAWSEGIAGYHQWEQGGAHITGSSYALSLGRMNEHVLQVQLALYGERGLSAPPAQTGMPTLGARALGGAMERALVLGVGSGWQRWLKLESPHQLLDIFDADDITTLGTLAFIIALPRNAAVLLSNSVALMESHVPALRLLPIYTQHERFARVEVAAHGDDLSGFMAQPRLIGLVTLTPGLAPLDRDAATAALRATVEAAAKGDEETHEVALKPLVAGQLSGIEGPAKLAPLRYFYSREGQASWVLWGYNLSDEAMRAEVARVQAGGQSDANVALPALFARVEPVALLRAASTYAPQQLTWLDINILAQRIGAMVFRVRADQPEGGSPTLIYEAELERPAR
jgi:hypothetical protein